MISFFAISTRQNNKTIQRNSFVAFSSHTHSHWEIRIPHSINNSVYHRACMQSLVASVLCVRICLRRTHVGECTYLSRLKMSSVHTHTKNENNLPLLSMWFDYKPQWTCKVMLIWLELGLDNVNKYRKSWSRCDVCVSEKGDMKIKMTKFSSKPKNNEYIHCAFEKGNFMGN